MKNGLSCYYHPHVLSGLLLSRCLRDCKSLVKCVMNALITQALTETAHLVETWVCSAFIRKSKFNVTYEGRLDKRKRSILHVSCMFLIKKPQTRKLMWWIISFILLSLKQDHRSILMSWSVQYMCQDIAAYCLQLSYYQSLGIILCSLFSLLYFIILFYFYVEPWTDGI